jgi:hypothetical protein
VTDHFIIFLAELLNEHAKNGHLVNSRASTISPAIMLFVRNPRRASQRYHW